MNSGIIALDDTFGIERRGGHILVTLHSGDAKFNVMASRAIWRHLSDRIDMLIDEIEAVGSAEIISFPCRR